MLMWPLNWMYFICLHCLCCVEFHFSSLNECSVDGADAEWIPVVVKRPWPSPSGRWPRKPSSWPGSCWLTANWEGNRRIIWAYSGRRGTTIWINGGDSIQWWGRGEMYTGLLFNSLAPGRFEWNFYVIFKIMLVIDGWVLWDCPQVIVIGPVTVSWGQSHHYKIWRWLLLMIHLSNLCTSIVSSKTL